MVNKVDGNNLSIFAGDVTGNGFMRMQNKAEEDTGLFGKSQDLDSRVEAKREEVRKKVMQVMKDQFERDAVSSDAINDGYDRLNEYSNILNENNEEIKNLRNSQKEMREEYGISEDSQEHQDMLIMVKARKKEPLKKEERERMSELNSQSRTLYQEKCLADADTEMYFNSFMEGAKKGIQATSAEISGTKLGILKQHGMDDAQGIMSKLEAAGAKEIIGMLQEEAMNHIQEELDEQVEDAKEAAEEKKDQEEKVEEAKAEQGEQEKELTESLAAGDSNIDKMQAEMNRILKEADLLDEDQKGILLDQQL